jgi:uncharacterized membrane protein
MEAIFRWLHVVAGILWIGLLWFFNFVNTPFAGTMDGETKKKVVPELIPRALYFFRWGAAWTWVTGLLLLTLIYYHGKQVLGGDPPVWTAGTVVMILVTFLAVFLYDALYKSPLAKNPKVAHTVAFVLFAVIVGAMVCPFIGNFSYRGWLIHSGALMGTTMAFNVWFRIWPSQRKIISAVKAGQAPDPAVVALAGARSRHNTYMSVPLIWTMIGQHSTFFAGGNLGISTGWAWLVWLAIVLIGWHLVFQLYKIAGRVKGF